MLFVCGGWLTTSLYMQMLVLSLGNAFVNFLKPWHQVEWEVCKIYTVLCSEMLEHPWKESSTGNIFGAKLTEPPTMVEFMEPAHLIVKIRVGSTAFPPKPLKS